MLRVRSEGGNEREPVSSRSVGILDDSAHGRTIETRYLEAWRALSPALRTRLRGDATSLTPREISEIARAPHPESTLSLWIRDDPQRDELDISYTFAEWARTDAPEVV